MRERAKELRARKGSPEVEGESAVRAALSKMAEPYRSMGIRLHSVIKESGPTLLPRTWYGMPAYSKDGEVVCFFRGGDKFKERYMTLGFNDSALLDEGHMWPTSYALTELAAADESKIASLVRRAVGAK